MLNNRLRGSSLLFSKKLTNENDFYLKSDFINKMYFYYIQKGYFPIIVADLLNLFISIFTVGFIIFLYNCVDYDSIFKVENDSTEKLLNYINIRNFFDLGWFLWTLLSFFIFYIFCKVIGIIDVFIIYKKVDNFYKNVLDIDSSLLKSLSWEKIVIKLGTHYMNDNITVFNVANRITIQDNYMIAMINHNVLDFKVLTSLMEWNFSYCFFHKLFDDEFKVNKHLFNRRQPFINSIKKRVLALSIMNFIFMPFILVLLCFTNLFEYGAKFYNHPSSLTSSDWTRIGKWKIRDYNELYHDFYERISHSKVPAREYFSQFPNKVLDSILGFLIFTLSSGFIFLLFLSLVNDNILTNLFIWDRSILWSLTVLGSLVTFLNSLVSDRVQYYPNTKMEEIQEIIPYIPDEWVTDAHRTQTKKKFKRLFQYKIITIVNNIVYTLFAPFQLMILYYKTEDIVDFFIKKSHNHSLLGYICKYSVFENTLNHDIDRKTFQSYNNFNRVNTVWRDSILE